MFINYTCSSDPTCLTIFGVSIHGFVQAGYLVWPLIKSHQDKLEDKVARLSYAIMLLLVDILVSAEDSAHPEI